MRTRPLATLKRDSTRVILLAWLALLAAGPATSRPLRIAAEVYPPFEYLEDGRPAGCNVDIMNKVFGDLGIEHEIIFYPFPRAWKMLQRGGIDAILSVSYHPSREDVCYFTDAQRDFYQTYRVPDDFLWLAHYVFFIDRARRDEITFVDYAQIKRQRLRVGIVRDYTYDSKLIESGCDLVQFSSSEGAFNSLLAGDIDLYPVDRVVGGRVATSLGVAARVMPLDKVMIAKPYHLLFSKRSTYLDLPTVRDRVYARIGQLRRSGDLRRLAEPYLQHDHMLEALHPIRFVAEEWPPFEYLEQGQPVGIDVELLASIMPALQRPYTIDLYPWSRAWKMAEKGQAEAVLSISYKASREPLLFYTDEQRAFSETRHFPSDYLWRSRYLFYIKKSREGKIRFTNCKQLAKQQLRVGVNRDYTYNPEFMQASLNRTYYPTTAAAFTALLADEIDIYPIDETVGNSVLQQMGVADSVTTLPQPLLEKPYLAPFCRRSPYPNLEAIWREFNTALRESRADGTYDQLRKTHGSNP